MPPAKRKPSAARKPAPRGRPRAAAPDASSMSLEDRAAEVRRGPGRPIDPNLPRAKAWIRIDDDEMRAWTAAADAAGHTISSWVRHVCNTAARR